MSNFSKSLLLDATERDVKRLKAQADEWKKNKPEVFGLPTGLDSLDKVTGGLVKGEVITLAGGTGSGKTALCMQVLEHAAAFLLKHKQPDYVLMFSCEMTRKSLYMRSACRAAGIDSMMLRRGQITEAQRAGYDVELDHLLDLPLIVVDRNLSSDDMLDVVASLQEEGITLAAVGVDYIQLVNDEGTGLARVDHAMRNLIRLKNQAEDAAILILSQYSRRKEWESQQNGKAVDRPPKLSDLKETGTIEQASDQVWAMHEPLGLSNYAWKGPKSSSRQLFILKNRNGPRGKVELWYVEPLTRFMTERGFDEYRNAYEEESDE